MELTTKDLSAVDAAYWAKCSGIKLQVGYWSFEDHPYLLEVMQHPSLHAMGKAPRTTCVMKAAQAGYTEAMVLITLWGLIHGHYPHGVLYLFPTQDEVSEFSKGRFAPLIAANPSKIGKYLKDTVTTNLKQVGDAFLYLRGARLAKQVDDSNSEDSVKLRNIPADRVVYDEFDLMDPDVPGKARERMAHSKVREEAFLSNPTTPGRGIAPIFERSDQRHWWRQCSHCGQNPPAGSDWEWFSDKTHGWTCAEVYFPDLVGRDDSGKGYIACARCGKPIGLSPGRWVPKEPSKSRDIWGYRWSQLTSPVLDPYEILQEYTHPPDGNIGDVVRFKLGQPYVSAQDQLTVADVLSCCGSQMQANSHPGPCAMGIDVRAHKNVVIGCRIASERYRILRVARVKTFDEIEDMVQRFHVRYAVCDVQPYTDEARQFQKRIRIETYLCRYSESTPNGTMWNRNTGLVVVNRTEIFDMAHRMVRSERELELPARSPEIDQFALECSNAVRIEEVDRKTKQMVFRYSKARNGPDDYRHALNYFLLAAGSNHLPVVGGLGRPARPAYANNEYSRV